MRSMACCSERSKSQITRCDTVALTLNSRFLLTNSLEIRRHALQHIFWLFGETNAMARDSINFVTEWDPSAASCANDNKYCFDNNCCFDQFEKLPKENIKSMIYCYLFISKHPNHKSFGSFEIIKSANFFCACIRQTLRWFQSHTITSVQNISVASCSTQIERCKANDMHSKTIRKTRTFVDCDATKARKGRRWELNCRKISIRSEN